MRKKKRAGKVVNGVRWGRAPLPDAWKALDIPANVWKGGKNLWVWNGGRRAKVEYGQSRTMLSAMKNAARAARK